MRVHPAREGELSDTHERLGREMREAPVNNSPAREVGLDYGRVPAYDEYVALQMEEAKASLAEALSVMRAGGYNAATIESVVAYARARRRTAVFAREHPEMYVP
jgi:hypothetical protein